VALGVIAAVLLAIGLVFPYIDMWKHNGRVVGLSFRFLAIDFAGAFFSLMALAAQRTFDILGGVSYISVMLLEIGIVFFHLLWLWRTRHVRRAAKDCGKNYDEYVNSVETDQHTAKRAFVPVDKVPQWPKTARVSAVLSALRNMRIEKGKTEGEGVESKDVESGQNWPEAERISAPMAATNLATPDATYARPRPNESISSARRFFTRFSMAAALRSKTTNTPVASQTQQESDGSLVTNGVIEDEKPFEQGGKAPGTVVDHSDRQAEH
jgi:hypothetical protein